MPEQTKDKRRHKRVSWVVPATVEQEERTPIRCRTVDVSESGALLSVNEALQPGAQVVVRFKVDKFELGPEKARVLRNDSAFNGAEILTAVEFEGPHRGLTEMMEFDRQKKQWLARRTLGTQD
jgi:c-di-GMP-binding flagellar brake protein YcgR